MTTEVSTAEVPRMELSLFEPVDRCPTCGTSGLTCTAASDLVNFVCLICGSCWHVELGMMYRVDPRSCPGCDWRDVCVAPLD